MIPRAPEQKLGVVVGKKPQCWGLETGFLITTVASLSFRTVKGWSQRRRTPAIFFQLPHMCTTYTHTHKIKPHVHTTYTHIRRKTNCDFFVVVVRSFVALCCVYSASAYLLAAEYELVLILCTCCGNLERVLFCFCFKLSQILGTGRTVSSG